MEQQLQAIGWRASTAQGKKTELGVSGGTLVWWKHGMQCRGRDMDPPPQHAGRLAGAELSLKGDLTVLLVSIYGYSGDGGGPNNLSLLEYLAGILESYPHWLVGGDWNLCPEELFITGWPTKIKGALVIQDADATKGTCFTSLAAKPSHIDYFVCSANMESMMQGTGMDRTAPFGTHRVVSARMASIAQAVLVPKLRTVAEIQKERPNQGITWKAAVH